MLEDESSQKIFFKCELDQESYDNLARLLIEYDGQMIINQGQIVRKCHESSTPSEIMGEF